LANRLRRAAAFVAGLALTLLPIAAAPARAGTEEFSTFHTETQEEDDESVLDHLLARMPLPWGGEWDRAPLALRSSQGCLTSGQWLVDTRLKLETPLGKTERFGLDYTQYESDISSYEFLDLWFRFLTRSGTVGAMFRPFHDKSRQDFALAWETGSDTSAFQLRAIYGLEDLFNNLWAWRQTRVGDQSEPYLRHPWEPALSIASRHERWRAELSGKYLTPSVKSVPGPTALDAEHHQTIWGTLADARVDAQALGLRWEAHAQNHQARSTDQPVDLSAGDSRDFRRSWSTGATIGRALGRRLNAEALYAYYGRTENYGPPVAAGTYDAIDRVLQFDLSSALAPGFGGRIGYMHDQITVDRTGVTLAGGEGTRKESRAYFGLDARFGRVSVAGVEGIELDLEPYQVTFHHDKAFLQLQARF
jgi:hypothetical protein